MKSKGGKRIKKRFILVGLLIVICILFYSFYHRDFLKQIQDFMQRKEPSPLSSKFENITLTGWHKGEKQWEIKAKFVEVSKDKKITNFKQITKGIFFQEGKPALYFQADEARYNSVTLNLEIKGKIKLSSLPEAEKKGVVLTTEELCWSAKEKRLVSKGKVKLTLANNTLEGDYLIADAKLEGVKINGNVKGRFDLEEKETTN